MLSKLEDVLKEKERELKLHQKFLSLVRFCREEVFPFATVPLERHIDSLKDLIENLIPEPKDRREELFSGEVFVLLATLYFHDIAAIDQHSWAGNGEILRSLDSPPKNLFLNNAIGRRVEIPEKGLELINSLVFSVKKIPLEWEITEDNRKAIVRNGRMLGEIFNFAHHMWDIFSVDSRYKALRRLQNPDLRLTFGEAALSVDSKEGIICIKCTPEVPYELHVLGRIRDHVETLFRRFTENVNGRLGFQYREINWSVEGNGHEYAGAFTIANRGVSSGPAEDIVPRWEEAAQLLDKLFRHGHALVVGSKAAGKSTLVTSFVMPQLSHTSRNVFYAEIWDRPVDQIREAIERASRMPSGGAIDIISTCKRLLPEGACFFVVDGCERLEAVSPDELEKLERFVEFCIDNEDVYLVAIGEKEEFFDWYESFRRIGFSAVFELKSLGETQTNPRHLMREGAGSADVTSRKIDGIVESPHLSELKEILWVLAGDGYGPPKRYKVSDIFFETRIDHEKIREHLQFLDEKGLVRRQEASGFDYYALSSRHDREPVCEKLRLHHLGEKREFRETLKKAGENGTFLDAMTLERANSLNGRMVFGREEMGVLIASMLLLDRDCTAFLDKSEAERKSFDTEQVLRLLSYDDPGVRERAIQLLARVQDEASVNPLLAHLRRENDPRLRMLLVDSFITLGKRRTVVALVKTLTEIGDQGAKIRAIDLIAKLPARRAREVLIEIAAVEREAEMIGRIDTLLGKLEEQ